jgi:integrase/recombinase XerD
MNKILASCLGDSIDRYLTLKEALGRRFAIERRVLEQLDDFMIKLGGADLTPTAFEDWCKTQLHISSGVRRNRMRIVRNFCLYRQRTEPNCFIPDACLFPTQHQVVQPYIFSERDIRHLLQTCASLSPAPQSPLRPQVYQSVIVTRFLATSDLLLDRYSHHLGILDLQLAHRLSPREKICAIIS